MFESLVDGLVSILNPFNLGMLMLGMLLGIIVGIIPGVGGTVGLAITIPFVVGVEPTAGIAMLIGLVAVTTTADTITCVLLSIPGTSGSVATIVDGYPMARKGEAARALSAAFVASALGGVLGAIILAVSIPIAAPLVLVLGSPEFFMLTILGISAVSMLSGREPLKSLTACGIGLMLASVGGAPLASHFRYHFGIPFLYDGIPLIMIALGVFGVAELVDLMIRGLPIAGVSEMGKGALQGIKDALAQKWLILRCSIIGIYIGFIPGMGTSVANWLGYGHAIQSAKGRGNFGEGDVRGVIGPESANNAARGGELIPTLMFGVPGSGSMALLLLALIIFGIWPGPDMVTKHLAVTFSMVWGLVIANVVGALICMWLAKPLAQVARVPIHVLAPFIFIILVMGAFQASQTWADPICLLVLGILGWTMKLGGFGRPPLIVGFVLGKLSERYLGLSIQRYGAAWLLHPGVIVIGIMVIATLFFGYKWQRRRSDGEEHIE